MVVTFNVLVMAHSVEKAFTSDIEHAANQFLYQDDWFPKVVKEWLKDVVTDHVRFCLKFLYLSYQHMNDTIYALYMNR